MKRAGITLLVSLWLFSVCETVHAAQAEPLYEFNIPQLDADDALMLIAQQSLTPLLVSFELTTSRQANALIGAYTLEEGIRKLLRGSGIVASIDDRGVIVAKYDPLFVENENREAKVDSGKVKKGLLASVATMIAGAGGAVAQENDAGDAVANKRDTIIVTAQKKAQNVQDVPISIAVLNEQALEDRRIRDFSDLTFAVPSLSIPARGGGGDRFVFLRGMGSIQGSTPLVGLYLDEASVTTFPGSSLDLRTYDVERVEVLRGPQGTLYGVGSMGGTIRFITKNPVLDTVSARADASFSFTEDGGFNKDVRGLVNLPLVEDKLGIRIAVNYVDESGWIEQPLLGKEDINDNSLTNLRVKGLWSPTDALDVRATAIVHRGKNGAPSTGEDDQGDYTQAFFEPTTPSGKHNYEFYNLTVDYDFGAVNFLSSTSYVDLERQQREIGYRVPFGATEDLLFHALFDEDTETKSFTQEVRLSSTGDGPVQWLVGAFYRDAERAEEFLDFAFGAPASPFFFDISTVTKTESWAVFGEASIDLTSRLQIGGGLRYFEDTQNDTDLIADVQDSAKFDALSPRVFVKYDLSNDVSVFASVAKGFRSGGLAGGLSVQPFEPDTVLSYELGAKASLLGNRLNGEVSIFYSDYSGVQVDSVNLIGSDLVQFTSNAGDAEIYGVDFEVSYHVNDQLSMGFGGEVIETEFVEINAVSASHAVGDPMDFVPNYHFGVWGQYDFEWGSNKPGYVRVDYNQQGESRYGNRTIWEFYESYSDVINMLNLSIGVEYNRWSVELYGENLLNDRGYIDAESIEQIAARGRPRTIGIQLGVEF